MNYSEPRLVGALAKLAATQRTRMCNDLRVILDPDLLIETDSRLALVQEITSLYTTVGTLASLATDGTNYRAVGSINTRLSRIRFDLINKMARAQSVQVTHARATNPSHHDEVYGVADKASSAVAAESSTTSNTTSSDSVTASTSGDGGKFTYEERKQGHLVSEYEILLNRTRRTDTSSPTSTKYHADDIARLLTKFNQLDDKRKVEAVYALDSELANVHATLKLRRKQQERVNSPLRRETIAQNESMVLRLSHLRENLVGVDNGDSVSRLDEHF